VMALFNSSLMKDILPSIEPSWLKGTLRIT
jgi:hypothetical protein